MKTQFKFQGIVGYVRNGMISWAGMHFQIEAASIEMLAAISA